LNDVPRAASLQPGSTPFEFLKYKRGNGHAPTLRASATLMSITGVPVIGLDRRMSACVEKLPLTATGKSSKLQMRQQFLELRFGNQQVGLLGVATVTRLNVPDQLGPNDNATLIVLPS
jgi:hypothetical protein